MVSKEPCGCRSNDTHWIELCSAHTAERAGREHERKLDSLQWLIDHHDRFPNEDNLRHVVKRLAEVGSAVSARPVLVGWIRANAAQVRAAGQKLLLRENRAHGER